MSFEFNPADEDPHGECRHEIHRLQAVNADLLEACKDARDTLAVAIRAGLDGFADFEEAEIVANHVTMKKLTDAIAKAKGESA